MNKEQTSVCSSGGCKRPAGAAANGKCCSACSLKANHSGACQARNRSEASRDAVRGEGL